MCNIVTEMRCGTKQNGQAQKFSLPAS